MGHKNTITPRVCTETDGNFTEISQNLPKLTELSRNLPKLTEISRNRFRVSVQTIYTGGGERDKRKLNRLNRYQTMYSKAPAPGLEVSFKCTLHNFEWDTFFLNHWICETVILFGEKNLFSLPPLFPKWTFSIKGPRVFRIWLLFCNSVPLFFQRF